MSVSSSQEPGFPEWLNRSSVSLEGESTDVADLVLLGLLLGSWDEFEQVVRRGVALQALGLAPVSREEVHAAATEFRYRHGLVSASEFKVWLAERSLRVVDLSGVLARRLLRERERARAVDGSAADIGEVLWAEAICGGQLRALALAAADRLAAAYRIGAVGPGPVGAGREREALARAFAALATGLPALGEDELRVRLRRLIGLGDALDLLREQVAQEPAIERCVGSHLLDWLQVRGEELVLESEGAAREGRLLLVEDHLSTTQVAARAGINAQFRRVVLDGATADAASALLATAPGEVAGPWLEADRWRLLLVTAKDPPSAREPSVRARATQELVREVLDRTLAGRVRWPAAL